MNSQEKYKNKFCNIFYQTTCVWDSLKVNNFCGNSSTTLTVVAISGSNSLNQEFELTSVFCLAQNLLFMYLFHVFLEILLTFFNLALKFLSWTFIIINLQISTKNYEENAKFSENYSRFKLNRNYLCLKKAHHWNNCNWLKQQIVRNELTSNT